MFGLSFFKRNYIDYNHPLLAELLLHKNVMLMMKINEGFVVKLMYRLSVEQERLCTEVFKVYVKGKRLKIFVTIEENVSNLILDTDLSMYQTTCKEEIIAKELSRLFVEHMKNRVIMFKDTQYPPAYDYFSTYFINENL